MSSHEYSNVRTGTCGGQLHGFGTWLTKMQFSWLQRRWHAWGRASRVIVGQASRASSAIAKEARREIRAMVFIVSALADLRAQGLVLLLACDRVTEAGGH